MNRLIMLAVLVLAMGVGFGCAKKSSDANMGGMQTNWTPEEQAAIQQIENARIHFAFNRFDLTAQAQNILREKADLMKANPRIRVRIEGNCDERGTQEYNLALGERRARAAFEYLVMLGVNAAQMELLSYGKENPLVGGSGESAWAQNRRDDFKVIQQ